jgi:hypothetical protein
VRSLRTMSKEEYRPQPSNQPEQHMPQQEGGNGAPGIPPRVHERANPPPEIRAYPTLPQKSALNRAVERTRDLYERNGWPFLPWGIDPPKEEVSEVEKTIRLPGGLIFSPQQEKIDQKSIDAYRASMRGATFFSIRVGEFLNKLKDQKDNQS